MASVSAFRNPSGATVWRCQFRLNKKPTQRTFLTKSDADKFCAMIKRTTAEAALEVLESRESAADMPTFREWAERYLDPASGLLTGIEPGTRAEYGRIAEASFYGLLGDFPVSTITKADIGKWVSWQEQQYARRWFTKEGTLKPGAQPIAAKTVKNRHALLSNILKAATELTPPLRPDNPAHRVRVSEGTSREPVFLSREEFAAIYEQIPTYYKPLVAFLVGSQARWSEATALNSTDVHRDTVPPTVRIAKAWKRSPDGPPVIGVTKTKRGRRTVSLWPALVDILDQTPGLLFKGMVSGERIWYGSFNTRIWHPAVKRAGIGKTPHLHDLRHTGASWLIADGKPLTHIQARLGHESIMTTSNIYGHLLPDAHTQMADSMESTMAGVLAPLLKLEEYVEEES